jgi:hypothetical protein
VHPLAANSDKESSSMTLICSFQPGLESMSECSHQSADRVWTSTARLTEYVTLQSGHRYLVLQSRFDQD